MTDILVFDTYGREEWHVPELIELKLDNTKSGASVDNAESASYTGLLEPS